MLDGNLKHMKKINSPVKVNNTWTNIKNTLILILFITPLGIFIKDLKGKCMKI